MSRTMTVITSILLGLIVLALLAMFVAPAFAGLDEVDYTCGWDRTASGQGYRYAVSLHDPPVHDPSPAGSLAVAKALHSDAQDGQAAWVAAMPAGVSTWYAAHTAQQRDAIYACELYRPAYQ